MSELNAVDELLKAEEKANQIIKAAYKEKDRKSKDAKIQAQEEIQIYRREKEQEFQQMIQKVKQKYQKYGTQNDESEVQIQLQSELAQIQAEYNQNQQKVIEMLSERIMDVEISVPQIMKGNFEEYFKQK